MDIFDKFYNCSQIVISLPVIIIKNKKSATEPHLGWLALKQTVGF